MRLVTFERRGERRVGVEQSDGGNIVDVCRANPSIPTEMRQLLEGGDKVMRAVRDAATRAEYVLSPAECKLRAPITTSSKVLCVGMNYVDHCTEQNLPVPKEPLIFNKFPSTIVGPGDAVILPPQVENLDYEVELVIVIGKECERVSVDEAPKYIAGYTVAHDVSARDWQLKRNGGQWLVGKSFPTFSPIGPAIVTADGFDPHGAPIRCRLNGKTVQDSNTSQLVFNPAQIVAWCSDFTPLFPGDIIMTGTPPGVGCFRNPPLWLKPGDVVECEVEGIGCISNPVVPQPARL